MSDETKNDSSGSGADKAAFRKIIDGMRGNAVQRRNAIAMLYTVIGPRIRYYMRRRVPDPAQAEDLTNDVFVKILSSNAEFRGDVEQFAAWYWTIARRVRLDRLRQWGIEDLVDDEVVWALERVEDDSPGSNPALCSCVQRVLDDFTRDYPDREQCLSWIVIDGMSSEQIAGVMGRSEHAARQYLSQCRKKLWSLLRHCFGDATVAES